MNPYPSLVDTKRTEECSVGTFYKYNAFSVLVLSRYKRTVPGRRKALLAQQPTILVWNRQAPRHADRFKPQMSYFEVHLDITHLKCSIGESHIRFSRDQTQA